MGLDDFGLQSNSGKRFNFEQLQGSKSFNLEELSAKLNVDKELLQSVFIKADSDNSGSIQLSNSKQEDEVQSFLGMLNAKFSALRKTQTSDSGYDELYEYKDARGNDVQEFYKAGHIVQKTIKGKDGSIAQILYSKGRPERKTEYKNGNASITLYEYDKKTKAGKNCVCINTIDSYMNQLVLVTEKIDENGKPLTPIIENSIINSQDKTISELKEENGKVYESVFDGETSEFKHVNVYDIKSIADFELNKFKPSAQIKRNPQKPDEQISIEYDKEGNSYVFARIDDTWAKIAKRFNVSVEELKSLNKDVKTLSVCTKVKIPGIYEADSELVQGRTSKDAQKEQKKTKNALAELYTSKIGTKTLKGNYKSANDYAAAILKTRGLQPDNPDFIKKRNQLANELILLNGAEAKYTKGSKIKVIEGTLNSKLAEELKNAGIKPNEDNQVFYARMYGLNAKQQQNVLAVVKDCRSRGITDTKKINAEILKYYPHLNMFDTDEKVLSKPSELDERKYAAEMLMSQIISIISGYTTQLNELMRNPFNMAAMGGQNVHQKLKDIGFEENFKSAAKMTSPVLYKLLSKGGDLLTKIDLVKDWCETLTKGESKINLEKGLKERLDSVLVLLNEVKKQIENKDADFETRKRLAAVEKKNFETMYTKYTKGKQLDSKQLEKYLFAARQYQQEPNYHNSQIEKEMADIAAQIDKKLGDRLNQLSGGNGKNSKLEGEIKELLNKYFELYKKMDSMPDNKKAQARRQMEAEFKKLNIAGGAFDGFDKRIQDFVEGTSTRGFLTELGAMVALMALSGGGALLNAYGSSAGAYLRGGLSITMRQAAKSALMRNVLTENVQFLAGAFTSTTAALGVHALGSAVLFNVPKASMVGSDIITGDTEHLEADAEALYEGTKGLTEFGFVSAVATGPLGRFLGQSLKAGLTSNVMKKLFASTGMAGKTRASMRTFLTNLTKATDFIANKVEFAATFGLNAGYMAFTDGMEYTKAVISLSQMDGVSKLVVAMLCRNAAAGQIPAFKGRKMTAEQFNKMVEETCKRLEERNIEFDENLSPEEKMNIIMDEVAKIVDEGVNIEAGVHAGVNTERNTTKRFAPVEQTLSQNSGFKVGQRAAIVPKTIDSILDACDNKFREQKTIKDGESIYSAEEKTKINELYSRNPKVISELLNLQANKQNYINPEDRFSPEMMRRIIELSEKNHKLYEKLVEYDCNFEWLYRENVLQCFEQAYTIDPNLADELFGMKYEQGDPRFFGKTLLSMVKNINTDSSLRDLIYTKSIRNDKEVWAFEYYQLINFVENKIDDVTKALMKLKTDDGKYSLLTSSEISYAEDVIKNNPDALLDLQNPQKAKLIKKELILEANSKLTSILYSYPNLKEFLISIMPENTYSVDVNTLSSDGSLSFICTSSDIVITKRFKQNENGQYDIMSQETKRDEGNTSHIWVEFSDGRVQVEDIEYEIYKNGNKEQKIAKNLTKTIFDKNGEPLYQEKTIQSDEVAGSFNVKGVERSSVPIKENVEIYGTKNPSAKITKEINHSNGMKTISTIIQGQKGGKSTYTILSKNGVVISEVTRTNRQISDNHYETTLNGQKYEVFLDGDKVIASRFDKNGNKVETITLDNDILDPQLKDLYKKLPGDFFFMLQKSGIKRVELCEGGSQVLFNEGVIYISVNDLNSPFVYAHEFGHVIGDIILNAFEKNPVLRQLFFKEFAQYQKVSSYQESKIIDYFTETENDIYGGKVGRQLSYLEEIIAETHALYSGLHNDNGMIYMRGIELQKHFPETMAFILKKINHIYNQVNEGTLKPQSIKTTENFNFGIISQQGVNEGVAEAASQDNSGILPMTILPVPSFVKRGARKLVDKIDNYLGQEKTLEGDIKDSELTEVAPFVRDLIPHSITDPFRILAEDIDERANSTNFDLTKYEKTGFPLKYSRQEFTQRLKDLVNNMPIEAQREILKKFNIELNYTGDGFELRDIPKIPGDVKTPLELAIKAEIERFTKENEIEIDNPEVKVFLDDFIKLAPEFLFIVGKKQHETHAYTVDVHTIKVLQNAIEHPEYKNLSAEDKMVLNTAILLHDIAKQFVDTKTPDDSHAEKGYNYAIKILDRFNLPSDIKQRIVKLIRNHEFFKAYNERYIPFKSEAEQNELGRQNAEKNGYPYSPRNDYAPFFNREVEGNAGRILNTSDFMLAKILTYSDLKSVNPDKTFIREEWNIEKGENEPVEYQGFEKFVTGTHSDAEFKEYLDESMSYIEKELQKYDGGKIEDEFVYETELAETGLKLFGRTDFFESITRKSGQNQPYAVHRSDFNMIIQARQALIDAGVKEKEVGNRLRELFKRKNDMFSPEVTSEFIKVYLENKDFIDSHGIKLGGAYSTDLRNAEMLKKEIAIIKEKESVAEIFKKYNVKDEWMQKRLVDSLYAKEYNREIGKFEPVFSKEAHGAMLELFDMKKFTPEEIYKIIYNSFSVKNHRGVFRNNGNEHSSFNRQIFDTILELSKEEPIENAIQDTHLCCVNATPESGWVVAPEVLVAIKELNKMEIKDKGFLLSTFDIKYKDGKGKNDNTRILESITKNERYESAIKYSRQGFKDFEVRTIIDTFEIENGKIIYSEAVQDKIANLVKLGVYPNCTWIAETLFDTKNYEYSFFKKETQKFNETNYNFIVRMINEGIPPQRLDDIIYHSGCDTYEAAKAAPDKMVETGKFSKAQVEAMVDFFKEIGFDKELNATTKNMYHDLAESFMDIVELTSEELEGMSVYSTYFDRMIPMSKMSEGMAPFRIVNKEKFNQALDYYKKGVSINNLKYLTETPELYKELKNEADLSFIKTENDADLVSTFWKMKDVKSINELSKQERIQFMNELMMHKSEIEGNNVSDKISVLPKDSQGYSDMMKNIADSFGLNSEPYTQQKVSQINKSFSDISARLQVIKPTDIETDNSINQIINEITSIVPNLNRQNISSILLTLQRVVKSPEYKALSESDKKLMNIAVIFSKVDSTSNNPFDSAIDACVFAKQIGLSDTDAMKIFAIVKNSNLTETVMSTKRNVKTNKSRSYIHIVTDDIKETFETAAMELKDYNNFQMAKLLYTANEDFVSPQMLQEYAPDLYQEFLNIRNSVKLENSETSKDAKAMQIMQNNPQYTDKLEEVKLKGRDKYSLSRNLNKLLEEQIDEIKSCDVLLPQTNLSDFIKKQSPEWIKEHTRNVNGRNVLVIGSDEIPDFYMLSHTTQAFNISGKADATTNMSNFENFAMLFNDKTICLSYSGNGKIAVVGNVGLLIQTPNTSQYIARGTDISSVAKDIPTMISEYISHRSQIIQKGRFQTKATKDYDRNFFASLIKEELAPGYRMLLDQKISLEEQIREYNSEKTNESLESLQQKLKDVKNQMRPIDKIYRTRIENLINKANGEVIDLEFIRNNDPELGTIYDKILNTINVEHRGNDGIMRTEYHNEVLGSNTKPVGLFVRGDKELFNLTDDYLQKAEEDVLPIVVYKTELGNPKPAEVVKTERDISKETPTLRKSAEKIDGKNTQPTADNEGLGFAQRVAAKPEGAKSAAPKPEVKPEASKPVESKPVDQKAEADAKTEAEKAALKAQKKAEQKAARQKRNAKLDLHEEIKTDQGQTIDSEIFKLTTIVRAGETPNSVVVAGIRNSINQLRKTAPQDANKLELLLNAVTKQKKCSELTADEVSAIVQHMRRQYKPLVNELNGILSESGAENLGEIEARLKSDTSLYDKIYNYAHSDKHADEPFCNAIADVRDVVGLRIVMPAKDMTGVDGIKELLAEGNIDEAGKRAAEIRGNDVVAFMGNLFNKLQEKNCTIPRLSNYQDKIGMSVISKQQISVLEIKAMDTIFIDTITEGEPEAQFVDWKTKTQQSAIPSFQFNVVTSDGRWAEIQIQYKNVHDYGVAEHEIYDKMSDKDTIGRCEDLETLNEPFDNALNDMTRDVYDKYYNNYTIDNYHHYFLKDFGINTPLPQLQNYAPEGRQFSNVLSAKNLIELHKLQTDVKNDRIDKEVAVEEYKKFLEEDSAVNPETKPVETTGTETTTIDSEEGVSDFVSLISYLKENNTYYSHTNDNEGNTIIRIISDRIKKSNGGTEFKYDVYKFDKDGQIVEELKNQTEKEVRSRFGKKWKIEDNSELSNSETLNSFVIPIPSGVKRWVNRQMENFGFGITKQPPVKASDITNPTKAAKFSEPLAQDSPVYRDINKLSEYLTAKFEEQAGNITPTEISTMVKDLSTKYNLPEKTILSVMSRLTQFGSYNQIDVLGARLKELGIENFYIESYIARHDTMTDVSKKTSLIGISTNASLYYLQAHKEQFNLATGTGKEALILDDGSLKYIEKLKQNNDPEYNEILKNIESGKLVLINLDGTGLQVENQYFSYTAFDGGRNLAAITEAALQQANGKINNLNTVLNGSFTNRAETLFGKDIAQKIENINIEPQTQTPETISLQIRQKVPSSDDIKMTIDEIINQRLGKDCSPIDRATAVTALGKYYDNFGRIYSSEGMAELLKTRHNQIQQIVQNLGKNMDDVVFFAPYINKSFGLVAQMYSKVNGIPEDNFVVFGGAYHKPSLRNEAALADGKVIVLLDDVIGSGNSALSQIVLNYSEFVKTHPNSNIIFSPLVCANSGIKAITENISGKWSGQNRTGKDFLLLDEENMFSLYDSRYNAGDMEPNIKYTIDAKSLEAFDYQNMEYPSFLTEQDIAGIKNGNIVSGTNGKIPSCFTEIKEINMFIKLNVDNDGFGNNGLCITFPYMTPDNSCSVSAPLLLHCLNNPHDGANLKAADSSNFRIVNAIIARKANQ